MLSPFSVNISPMKRLFLINFEKDPDEIYIGLEPQWFDDASYGTGLRIIAWRKDGYIDVYQQPALTQEEKIDVAAKGLAETLVRPMSDARFDVTAHGIDVAFSFIDKLGREIKVEIVEKNKKKKSPFSLLAPVGSSSENPSFLPVYFMYQFDFVRRSQTNVVISVNGRMHKADPFSFPLNGSRVYYMRYSADTFLVDWCPAQSKELEPLKEKDNEYYSEDGTFYTLEKQENGLAITGMSSKKNNHVFSAEFDPAFPLINYIEDHTSFKGTFSLSAEESSGHVNGVYSLLRKGDEIEITLQPSCGWLPKPTTNFLKFLFKVARIFKQWPKTYLWTARIKLSSDQAPSISSKWSRV